MQPKKIIENTGIRIIDIILIKSCFNLKPLDISNGGKPAEISLKTNYDVKDGEKILQVLVSLYYEVKNNNDEPFLTIEVEKVGLFEFDRTIEETLKENNIPSIEQFVSINAASIIYSYIRQHITDLSLKARIGPIFLPIVNFVKLKQEK